LSNSDPSQPFEADDIIYTAQAQARIDYLWTALTELERANEAEGVTEDDMLDELERANEAEGVTEDDMLDELRDEYDRLLAFRDAFDAQWGAWDKGASLVRDSYWDTYAQYMAEDIYGDAARTEFWNARKWASELTMDYTSVSYDGVTYWGDGK
jgi:hypothetical protein